MPVRVKQRTISPSKGAKTDGKELEALKKQLVALLLSHHVPMRVIMRDAEDSGLKLNIRNNELLNTQDIRNAGHFTNTMDDKATSLVNNDEKGGFRPLNLPLICSILSQASYIEPSNWNAWIKTAARTLSVNVRGAISLRPAPSKHVQFISLGTRPVLAEIGGNVLYDEINRIFASSSFGNQEEISDSEEAKRSKDRRYKQDGYTNKQLKGGGKGVDRWPMFFIRVDLQQNDDLQWLEREGTLGNISKVLGAMVHGFLKDNHFRPRGGLKPRRNFLLKGRPSPKIVQNPGDFLSSWSRIKSSVPTERPALFSSKNNDYASMDRHLESKVIAKVPETSAAEEPGLENGEIERTVEWRNPISKAKILVNSRTGLVVSQSSLKRPATAPSILQSSTLGLPRLTRSASNAVVPAKEGSWAGNLLSNWENPVFAVSEQNIPQVSVDGPNLEASETLHGRGHQHSDADIQKAFAQPSSTVSARMSKEALKSARVIAQVDKKFILISIDNSASDLLVLVDQHAADERIRVEVMLTGVRTQAPTLLAKPIVFEVHTREQRLFADYSTQFEQWGIRYDLTRMLESQKCRLVVKALPQAIAERCRVEPKMLIELLRGEVWKLDEQSGYRPCKTLPQGILDMLNSRACRSAIMFNDKLSHEETEALIRRLADCSLPFQCAHGRPSMVPLVDIGTTSHFGGEAEGAADGVQTSFGQAWERWKASEMYQTPS